MPTDYDVEVDELRAIAGRDPDAFKRWFTRCESPLKRSLQTFAELVDVESVVQDTGFKVWQNASHITPDGRPGFMLRWSKKVARNSALSIVRRPEHRLDHDVPRHDGDEPEDKTHRTPDPFFGERVRRCFERLKPLQRRAFDARIQDDGVRSDRELAASIGMGFDAFRQNLARGRKALVQCLASFKIDVAEYLR